MAPAVGLIAGIAIDDAVAVPAAALVVPLVAATALLAIGRRRPRVRVVAVGVAFAALGAARHDLAARHWPTDHVARFAGDAPILATVRGVIRELPVVWRPDASQHDRPGYALEPRTTFVLDAAELIDAAGQRYPASGLVAVSARGAFDRLAPGDAVRAFGWLARVRGPANPGEYDRRRAAARDGVLVSLAVNTAALAVDPAAHRPGCAAGPDDCGPGWRRRCAPADRAPSTTRSARCSTRWCWRGAARSTARSTTPSARPATRTCWPPAG
ncbi:MAG: DUF4131 domain-containing protein [Phycisphaerae bacterium]